MGAPPPEPARRSARAAAAGTLAGDPRLLRSEAWVAFFERVLRRNLQRSFHAVRLARPGVPWVDADLPLVVYSNHPSWWDAALVPVLTRRFWPARRGFGPIDAAALERYGFMRRLGLFPVQADSFAGAAAFMRTGRRLLAEPDVAFCLTPEGRFTDPRERPVRLRAGLAGLMAHVPRVTVLPLAIEYPFWTERTPEALVRFGAPLEPGSARPRSPADVQGELESRLTAAMDALAADAASRDPARFETLLDGRAGVGGVYDGWRRLKAWCRGERFDPAHLPATFENERPR